MIYCLPADTKTKKLTIDKSKTNMNDNHSPQKKGSIRVKSQEKILQAAQDEFIFNGYKGATVQSIADKAGLPKANVLYYYKNKENIYHAVLEQTLTMWDQGIGDINYEDGPKLAVEKFIAVKVNMSFLYPKASKIYAMEVIQGAQHLKEFARTYQRKWVREKSKIFQQWANEGKMLAIDPVSLIFLIWSSTQHYADFETQILTIKNRADYEQEDAEQVTQFLTDFILRGIGVIK